jgi:hypothetical protein
MVFSVRSGVPGFYFTPKKGENPLVRCPKGFRSLKINNDIGVWVGILIGPLFPQDLFIVSVF